FRSGGGLCGFVCFLLSSPCFACPHHLTFTGLPLPSRAQIRSRPYFKCMICREKFRSSGISVAVLMAVMIKTLRSCDPLPYWSSDLQLSLPKMLNYVAGTGSANGGSSNFVVFRVLKRMFFGRSWGRPGFDSGFRDVCKHAGRVVRPVSQC